jgi:hypothetical protein
MAPFSQGRHLSEVIVFFLFDITLSKMNIAKNGNERLHSLVEVGPCVTP